MKHVLLCLLILAHALPSVAFLGSSKLYKYCRNNEWGPLVKRAASKDHFDHAKYQDGWYNFLEPCISSIINARNMDALFAILKITNKKLTSNQIKGLIRSGKINEIKILIETGKINLLYSVKIMEIYNLILNSDSILEWTKLILTLITEHNNNSPQTPIDINKRLSSGKTLLGHLLEKGQIEAARLLIEAGASIYEALVYEYTKDHWMLIDVKEEHRESLYEMLIDYVDESELRSFLNDTTQNIQSLLLRFLAHAPHPQFDGIKALKNYFEQEALNNSFPISHMRPWPSQFSETICVLECEDKEEWLELACGHIVCVTCLQAACGHDEKKPLTCLAKGCSYFLTPREKSLLRLEPHLISSQEHFFFQQFIKTFPGYEACRQQDCPGYSLSKHHYEQGTTHVECIVCKTFQCIECGAFHPTMKCPNEKKDQKFIEDQLAAGLLARCPFCKMPAAKIDGCTHVTCADCKRSYSWIPQRQVQ